MHDSPLGFQAARLGPAFLIVCLASLASAAQAQTTIYKEDGKLIRAPRAVGKLGVDLFGDKVNFYTGSLEFVQSDVSIPGNSALPVAVGRRAVTGQETVPNTLFGNWDLEIPHLHGFFASSTGWATSIGTNRNARCSAFGAPPTVSGSFGSNSTWKGTEYWHGSFLYVPGQGDQEMLRRSSGFTQAPGGNVGAYPVVTRNNWTIRCTSTLDPQNGTAGEGFIAVAPDGTEYRFDWLVSRSLPILTKSSAAPEVSRALARVEGDGSIESQSGNLGGQSMPNAIGGNALARAEVWILPTVVTDRFGNTVRYGYDPVNKWQLNTITGSDADGNPRVISLHYSAVGSLGLSRVSSVSDGTRTWTYEYDSTGSTLSTVRQPDNAIWQLGGIAPLMFNLDYGGDGNCDGLASSYRSLCKEAWCILPGRLASSR